MNRFKGYAKGRAKRTSGEMNGTEYKYSLYLESLKNSGEILEYWFEPMSMQLSKGCFYRPDFLVMMKDYELEIHEVKGFWEDDALVKIKVASEKFPFKFKAIKKRGSSWDIRTVGEDNLTSKKELKNGINTKTNIIP